MIWKLYKQSSSGRGWFAQVLHEITLSSPQKFYLGFSWFIWVCLSFLGVVYLVYLGLIGVQTVNIISLIYVGTIFENLESKFILRVSGVSELLFWAIEPIRKDGNDEKFRKSHFSGKLMNRVLFSLD